MSLLHTLLPAALLAATTLFSAAPAWADRDDHWKHERRHDRFEGRQRFDRDGHGFRHDEHRFRHDDRRFGHDDRRFGSGHREWRHHHHQHDHWRPHGWDRGHWHRGWVGGRHGWWWVVDQRYYSYAQPVYPYPYDRPALILSLPDVVIPF